ncbi:MAG: sugar transferase [Parabacteroides distasonis]
MAGEEGFSGTRVFRQERIGYLGQPFGMYKFRTMYVNAEENGPSLSSEDDPCDAIRTYHAKYRLDELPQFWNVLKGYVVGRTTSRTEIFYRRDREDGSYYYLLHNVRRALLRWGW